MASLSDVTPFFRKPRVGSTPKIRPAMKIEWNKLLAEATEKDTELKTDAVDKEAYYDDEFYDLEDGETDEKTSTGKEGENPLNLCYKAHTMPSVGNQIQSSLEVLDLSTGKKIIDNNVNRTPSVKNFCTVPNFQFSQKSNDCDKKETVKCIENKENTPCKNVKSMFNTPCNNKFGSEKNERVLEENNKIKNNLIFVDKKPAPNSMLSDRNMTNEDANKVKPDFVPKKVKSTEDEKRSNSLKPSVQVKPSPTSQSEKFAVPAAPAKPKEASKIIVVNRKPYQILAPLGKGGSSKVYLVLSNENELLAVKCVKLSDVSESTKNDYLNEIQHLLKMQHSKHVIKLYDHQYLTSQKLLLAVMEKGDTDLSRFLKDKASSDEGISPELIMYYWTEMLMAVKSIHDNNIIHRDLKPTNFLLVSGRLKLIDFGIASSIQTEQTSVLMESQSGTFNYMSPEALQDLGFDNKVVLKIGRKTDVWSLGCILYYFLYKKTPYQDLVKPLHKLKAITDPNYQVSFPKISGVPDILIESCKRCLIHDTKKRASIEELLAFRNRPLFSLSQVLNKLKNVLSAEEYEKATKAFENAEGLGE